MASLLAEKAPFGRLKHRKNRRAYGGPKKGRGKRLHYGHQTATAHGKLTGREKWYVRKQGQKGRFRRGEL